MGIAILVRRRLYIELAPWVSEKKTHMNHNIMIYWKVVQDSISSSVSSGVIAVLHSAPDIL